MPLFVRPQTPKMADEDFTQLWERHLVAARRDFFRDDISKMGQAWDEKIDSVVDALDELAVSSASRDTHSPSPLWSARDDYTETALSSPLESSFSVKLHSTNPTITISDHDHERENEDAYSEAEPMTPMVEIGGRRSKGKELASYYLDKTRLKKLRDWHNGNATPTSHSKHLLYKNYNARSVPFPSAEPPIEPDTPVTSFRDALHTQNQPPSEVHVLVLSWAKHDRRGDDGQLLSPGLDIETDTVRACFKRRGYRVQCRVIPEDYPTSAVETMLHRFLEKSREGVLLVVYYHGYGNMEGERMVFSSGFGGSYFYWDDIRDPIISSPGEILMVLDCCASPGAEQPEILMDPGLVISSSTKQLLGVCSPYSSDNVMTKALCRVLDDSHRNDLVSVQGLCSQMKEDLREHDLDSSSVFVTQLGGGQLLDIYLPRLGNVD